MPPNILYLHSHDTGRFVQPYGYAVPTPNIQSLAESGILFRQAFCAAPTCSPSRASLLTGQFPHSNGMLGLVHRGFSISDYGHHLAHTLRKAGYFTAAVGIQHIARHGVDVGYDRVLATASQSAPDVAPAVAAFLTSIPALPYFLSVGFFETHRPFHPAGASQDARYILPPSTLPDTPPIREDMAAFQASARVLDDGIGTILRALQQAGLEGNTLVICTTDHGAAFPAMKCNLTDRGIGVELILRGPDALNGGQVVDAMVSQIDLFPTLCDLAGIEPPAWLQGRSLMPLIRHEVDQLHDAIFAEINYHAAYEPERSVRTLRYKYIRHFDGRTTPVLPNTDDSPGKDLWNSHGWKTRSVASEQLYDLIFDPNEANNLVSNPAYAQALREMRERLDRWMQDTQDPLLQGPIPAPAAARLNDPNGYSPSESIRPVP